jgi:hypothetical protein
MTIEFVDSRKHQAKIDARFDHRHYISQCMAPARSAIEEIFDSEAEYTFFQTRASPVAEYELKKHKATNISKKCGVLEWKIEPVQERESVDVCPYPREPRLLYLTDGAMNSYCNLLAKRAKAKFGKDAYAQFGIIYKINEYKMSNLLENNQIPLIHVVKADKESAESFCDIVANLHKGKYRSDKEPVRYTLQKADTSPLVVTARRWNVNGTGLKAAMDFLVPFIFSAGDAPGAWD